LLQLVRHQAMLCERLAERAQAGVRQPVEAHIELGDVTGSVTATAAAIGNSVSINNLPVD
jgi:hypothetical protein